MTYVHTLYRVLGVLSCTVLLLIVRDIYVKEKISQFDIRQDNTA